MTDEELREHKERMLLFCKQRNLAIDEIIAEIEEFLEGQRRRGGRSGAHPLSQAVRLLNEALRVINKLTGK